MKTILAFLKSPFLKFLMVGGLNALFGYFTFTIFILLKFPFFWATLVSTILGILFNFKTFGTLVFKSHDNRLLFRFLVTYGVVFLINVGIFYTCKWACTDLGLFDGPSWKEAVAFLQNHLNFFDWSSRLFSLLMGLVTLLPLAAISYVLQKRFVFPPAGAKSMGQKL